MSPGYGERIYVKRKKRKPIVWVGLPLLLTLTLWLFMNRPTPSAPTASVPDSPTVKIPENPSPMPPDTPTEDENRDAPSPLEGPSANESPNTPQIPSESPSALPELLQAESLMEKRQYREVISLLKSLAQHIPIAALMSAEAHYALQHYAESQPLFEYYLSSDPNNHLVISRLVMACYEQNELDQALEWCETGLKRFPGDGSFLAFQNKVKRELASSSQFVERESEHFAISFDRNSHEDIRYQISTILESAYRKIGYALGVYPERTIPVILYTQKSFFDVTRAPGWAGGLYDGKIRLPVGSLIRDESELTRILTHEYVHALVSQLTAYCPRWINEGLAEYHSQDQVPDIGQRIPLSQLEHTFPAAPIEAVAMAYAESHSAVAYLIKRYSLHDLIRLLKRLGEGESFRDAFEEVYYIPFETFASNWGN